MNNLKARIADNFSSSSEFYDQYAVLQRKGAQSLAEQIKALQNRLVPGPILEVGCGTGRLSRALIETLPDRQFVLTDIAPGMVARCRKNLSGHKSGLQIDWRIMDAEEMDDRNRYACIVSGLTIQWFQYLEKSMVRLAEALLPGGWLLCSFIGPGSFAEWIELCESMGLGCTVNPMPDSKNIVAGLRDHMSELNSWIDNFTIKYASARDFFNSLKKTGSSTSVRGVSLSAAQMRSVLHRWDQSRHDAPLEVSYSIHYILARK